MAYNGTIASDLVGGNDGTLIGNAVYVRDRGAGGRWAWQFDGSGKGTAVDFGEVLRLGFPMSASAWVFCSRQPTFHQLVLHTGSNESATYSGIECFIHLNNNNVEVLHGFGTGGTGSSRRRSIATTTAPPYDRWTLISFSCPSFGDGSIYFDGEPQPVTQSGSASTFGYAADSRFRIGGGNNGGVRTMNGLIDDVRLWERVLTPAEHRELYRRGYERRIDPGSASLFICPSLDNFGASDGGVALDLSGQGNNGTLTGAAGYASDGDQGGRRSLTFSGAAGDAVDLDSEVSLAGDFDIQFWRKLVVEGVKLVGSSSQPFSVQQTGPTNVRVSFGTDRDFTVPANAGGWNHLRISRSGTDLRVFQDGTESVTGAITASETLLIGRIGADSAGGDLNGSIDDLRIDGDISKTILRRGYQPVDYLALDSEIAAYVPTLDIDANNTQAVTDLIGGADATGTDLSWAIDDEFKGERKLSFNGSTSYASIGTSQLADDARDLTLMAWVQTTSAATEFAWSQTDSASANAAHGIAKGLNNWFYFNDQGIVSGSSIRDGAWHHIAASIRGGVVSLYLDGAPDGGGSQPVYTGAATDTAAIGARIGSTISSFWTGSIDGLRIFGRGLLQKEIEDIYAQGRPGQPFSHNRLIGLGVHNQDLSLASSHLGQDTAGSLTTDRSIYGRDASLISAGSAIGPNNYLPSAVDFTPPDGRGLAGDYFDRSDGSRDLPFTIALQFRADSIPAGDEPAAATFLLTKESASNVRQWSLHLSGSTKLGIWLSTANNAARLSRKADAIAAAAWYAAAVSYDGSQVADGLRIFVNGVIQTLIDTSVPTYTGMAPNAADVSLANWSTSNPAGLDGRLADIHLFERQLLQSEAAQPASGPEPICLTLPSLTAAPQSNVESFVNTGAWILDPEFPVAPEGNGLIDFDLYWLIADDDAGSNAQLVAITTAPVGYTPTPAQENKYLAARLIASNNGGYDPAEQPVTPYQLITAGVAPSGNIRLGSSPINDAKLGAVQVNRIYLGVNQVFP